MKSSFELEENQWTNACQHEYLQQQGWTEDQSAVDRYSASAIGATEFYQQQNVPSTVRQKSALVQADGTQNILPSNTCP